MHSQELSEGRNQMLKFISVKAVGVSVINSLTSALVLWKVQRSDTQMKVIRLGTAYGGWYIPEFAYFEKSYTKLVISAGIGMDVSFDRLLLDAGFRVIALDPLKSCVTFARDQLGEFSNFEAVPKGLWSSSGVVKFYAPKHSHHDSWSAVNVQNTNEDQTMTFEVISLEDLYLSHQLSGYEFTMLKMDIEGADIELIKSLNLTDIAPDWLGIELDYLSLIPVRSIRHRMRAIRSTRKQLHALSKKGYRYVLSDNFNFYWAKD